MAQRIVIVGGAGFIGSHVAEAFVRKGAEVTVVDDGSTGLANNVDSIKSKIAFLKTDATHPRALSAYRVANVVVYLAALVSVPMSIEKPYRAHAVNVDNFVRMLECLRGRRVRVVFASSAAVYGNEAPIPTTEDAVLRPASPYGLHKMVGEQYLDMYAKLYGIEYVSLRFFNVYGPRQRANSPYSGVISIFMDRASRGEPLTIFGDGSYTRDFVHVSDVARACVLAATKKGIHDLACNLGSGKQISIREVAETINRIWGSNAPILYKGTRAGDIQHSLSDSTRAKKTLGWKPSVTFEKGIKDLKRHMALR